MQDSSVEHLPTRRLPLMVQMVASVQWGATVPLELPPLSLATLGTTYRPKDLSLSLTAYHASLEDTARALRALPPQVCGPQAKLLRALP